MTSSDSSSSSSAIAESFAPPSIAIPSGTTNGFFPGSEEVIANWLSALGLLMPDPAPKDAALDTALLPPLDASSRNACTSMIGFPDGPVDNLRATCTGSPFSIASAAFSTAPAVTEFRRELGCVRVTAWRGDMGGGPERSAADAVRGGGDPDPPLSADGLVDAAPADIGVIPNPASPENGLGPSRAFVDGRRDVAGDRAPFAGVAGVGGPTWPWSIMCSRAASSVRHILQRIRRRGTCAPGVGGLDSESGVVPWGKLGNIVFSGSSPPPSEIRSA